MNSLKTLLINSFNGFLIGWFGGSVISLAEIITSANTSVTNFYWLFFCSDCIGIFYLYFANLEEIRVSKKSTIFIINILMICIVVSETDFLLRLFLQGQSLLYTKLYTGI